MKKNWAKSKQADLLRGYIDKYLKPTKPGMKHLDREVIIAFVTKEIENAQKK